MIRVSVTRAEATAPTRASSRFNLERLLLSVKRYIATQEQWIEKKACRRDSVVSRVSHFYRHTFPQPEVNESVRDHEQQHEGGHEECWNRI